MTIYNEDDNFLDYRDAYEQAKGRGVQGSIAEIVIMTPPRREDLDAGP